MAQSTFEKVLSSYIYLGNRAYYAASSVTADDTYAFLRWFLLDMPVVPFLLAFHSLFAALKTHEISPRNTFWLKSLVLATSAAFGGSTLAAVLSGRPAPLFTVASNFMMSYILIAWYLVHTNSLVRAILRWRPVYALVSFGAMAAKSRAMFNFMDDYVREYPQAVAGAIILGGLSGSGGQLFMSVEKIVQKGMSTPSEFSSPGWGFKSAYIAALAYYIAIDPEDILYDFGISVFRVDRVTARFYISAALCFHSFFETLYGAHINPLFWFDYLFYKITGLHRDLKSSDPPQTRPEPSRRTDPTANSSTKGPHVMSDGLRKRR